MESVKYEVDAVCNNCGWYGKIKVDYGVLITSAICPQCECHGLIRDTRKMTKGPSGSL